MFDLPKPLNVNRISSWAREFCESFDKFSANNSSEVIRVAYYYNKQPDDSTFRFRVLNMIDALTKPMNTESILATWFAKPQQEELIKILQKIDILVICRSTIDSSIHHILSLAKVYGVRIIFDIDDFVFSTKEIPLLVNTITSIPGDIVLEDDLWQYWYGYVSRIRETLDLCDEVIASTDYLADKIRNATGKKTQVVENFLGKKQLDFSRDLFEKKISLDFQRTTFTLGYFSGSPSHDKDFQILLPAVRSFLDSHSDARLLIVGYLDAKVLEPLDCKKVQHVPYTNFFSLQYLNSLVQLNLAPLQDNDFTRCKSGLKYINAAAVGVVTAASSTLSFSTLIKDGTNGFLLRDSDWQSFLEDYYESFELKHRKMAHQVFDDAIFNYSPHSRSNFVVQSLLNKIRS